MLAAANDIILHAFDFLLGWVLARSAGLCLVVVSLASAAILTAVRLFTTDQSLFRRRRSDRRVLKKRIRDAKSSGNVDTVSRLQRTRRQVAVRSLVAEGRPLLASLVPIAVLGFWLFQRLDYHPAQPGETVALRAFFELSAVGEVVHLVPVAGIAQTNGWIQTVEEISTDSETSGAATWNLTGEARDRPYELLLRHGLHTFRHDLVVGGVGRSSVEVLHTGGSLLRTRIELRPVRPFGFVPGVRALAIPPWLVAYLALTLLLTPLIRRVCRID